MLKGQRLYSFQVSLLKLKSYKNLYPPYLLLSIMCTVSGVFQPVHHAKWRVLPVNVTYLTVCLLLPVSQMPEQCVCVLLS
jgi:hypothetical protein